MANEVVVLANQFLVGVAADCNKSMIAVGDDAPGVSHRHQHVFSRVVKFCWVTGKFMRMMGFSSEYKIRQRCTQCICYHDGQCTKKRGKTGLFLTRNQRFFGTLDGMLKKISVEQLKVGMYLKEFCGSWRSIPSGAAGS